LVYKCCEEVAAGVAAGAEQPATSVTSKIIAKPDKVNLLLRKKLNRIMYLL
jgi:hypothetical protein